MQMNDMILVSVYDHVGLNAVAGRPPEEYGMEPTALSHATVGDIMNQVAQALSTPFDGDTRGTR